MMKYTSAWWNSLLLCLWWFPADCGPPGVFLSFQITLAFLMSVLVKKPFLTGLVVFLLTVFWGSLGFTALYRRLPAALEWTLCLLSPFAFTAGMAQVRVHETISLFHSLCVLIAQSCPAPLSMNSPGQNTGVGSRSLLQGIFPTQGLKPGLPQCRWILYSLSHQGRD